jgi:hypothetical protein
MIIKNPENYKLINFRKSNTKNKKYDAILMDMKTNKLKYVPFGDVRYQQYKDITPLKLYKHLDHNNDVRRNNYRKRHDGEQKNKYSSGYFSYYYLW